MLYNVFVLTFCLAVRDYLKFKSGASVVQFGHIIFKFHFYPETFLVVCLRAYTALTTIVLLWALGWSVNTEQYRTSVNIVM
jgi:hypothetical protein